MLRLVAEQGPGTRFHLLKETTRAAQDAIPIPAMAAGLGGNPSRQAAAF